MVTALARKTAANLFAVAAIALSLSLTQPLSAMAQGPNSVADLAQSLLDLDIVLEVTFDANLHDREIRLDNGWVIKIGRGLDFYQKPGGWFEVGANDLSLRKCLETKVDIFRV